MQAGAETHTKTRDSSQDLTLPEAPKGGIRDLKCIPTELDPQELLTCNFLDLASRYRQIWSETYKTIVSDIATQVGTLDNKILASICIPVAGAQEAQRIYRCIQAFGYQTLSNERFEISLLVNYAARDLADNHGNINQLFSEIDRARSDFPDLKVRTATLKFDSYEEISIGYLRSLLSDAVIERALRSSRAEELVMLRCDADTRAVKQQKLESHIRLYNSRPNVLSIQGGLIWSPEGLAESPEHFVNLALFSLEHTVAKHRNLIGSWPGPAQSIRGTAYCWIGGYNPYCAVGEDNDLARRLFKEARSSRLIAIMPGGPGTRVVTSNRRAVQALNLDLTVSSQWEAGPTEFRNEDHNIRELSEGNSDEPNSSRLKTSPKEIRLRLSSEDVRIASGKSRSDHNYLKAKQLLSDEGILARLHQTHAVDGHLVNRMLRDLPQNVANFRGAGPDSVNPIRDACSDDGPITEHFNRYLWRFVDWSYMLAYAIQKSIERSQVSPKLKKLLSMGIENGLDTPTIIDLTNEDPISALTKMLERQALHIHVRLQHKWGEATLILRADQDRTGNLLPTVQYHPHKSSVGDRFKVNKQALQVFQAFSQNMEEQLANPNLFIFEPARLIADRLVAIITNSLNQLELEHRAEATKTLTIVRFLATLKSFRERARAALDRSSS